FGFGVLVAVGHIGFHAVGIASFFAFAGFLLVLGLGVFALPFALLGLGVRSLRLFGRGIVHFHVLGFAGVLHVALRQQVEVAQHLAHCLGEGFLILIGVEQALERSARAVLDFLAPELDQRLPRGRHRHTG